MSALESLVASFGQAPMLDSLSLEIPQSSTAVIDEKQGMRPYPTLLLLCNLVALARVEFGWGGNARLHADSVRLQFVVKHLSTTKVLKSVCGGS